MTLSPPDIGRPLREYGNAILSRLPIEAWDHVPLPAWPGLESRGLLRASVLADKVPGAVWTAHLSHENPEQRAEQARAITRIILTSADVGIARVDLIDVGDASDHLAVIADLLVPRK